jgi:hypothetical protein
VYDRPGRRPAAQYEPDPVKLQASCRLHGGTDFACQWVVKVFKYGVTLDALVRPLTLMEIENTCTLQAASSPLWHMMAFYKRPIVDGFECCLCMVDKRTWWKHKKDAIRHLRKFHFGLGNRCDTWCVLKAFICVSFEVP